MTAIFLKNLGKNYLKYLTNLISAHKLNKGINPKTLEQEELSFMMSQVEFEYYLIKSSLQICTY